MPGIRFPKQRNELQTAIRRAHLTYPEIAERTRLKVETVEKYAEGWQEGGQSAVNFILQVCKSEEQRLNAAAGKGGRGLELHEEVVKYAGKLLDLPKSERDLAQKLIDALAGAVNKVNSGEDEKGIRDISQELDREAVRRAQKGEPGPSSEATKTSEHTAGRGRDGRGAKDGRRDGRAQDPHEDKDVDGA